jgi:SP family general alpha glucoside:H+ symporter-like MFS transporter
LYKHTDDLETAVDASMSFSDCFKGANLRRTEIVSMIWVIQAFCGSSLMGFSTYFFLQAGLDTSNAFSMSVGQYSLGAIGIVISWFLLPHVGRRPLYLGGLVLMFVFLLVIGFMGIVPSGNKSAQWAIGAMLLVFTMAYNCSVGPVCYCLVAEIPSSRLRQKTVVLARNAYNIAMIVANIITPRMLNTTALGWGAKSAFFWAGMCFLCVVYTYFRVPEPKGRTVSQHLCLPPSPPLTTDCCSTKSLISYSKTVFPRASLPLPWYRTMRETSMVTRSARRRVLRRMWRGPARRRLSRCGQVSDPYLC